MNNDLLILAIGLCVFQIPDNETERVVSDAIEVGYRLFDTAEHYHNEAAVGKAIRQSGIPRKDIFVTTKIWFKDFESEDARRIVLSSLEKMKLDYLDLVLLHQPFGNYYAAYRVLEDLQQEGLIRSIGVSNFEPDRLIDLCNFNNIVPQVNQVETNLTCQMYPEHEWFDKYKTVHMAWSPLARGGDNLFHDPELVRIGNKYDKTPAQVALRSLIQRNIIPIPKTTHKERMKENLDVFDFVLSEEDMRSIAAFDTGKPHADHADPKIVLWAYQEW